MTEIDLVLRIYYHVAVVYERPSNDAVFFLFIMFAYVVMFCGEGNLGAVQMFNSVNYCM